MLSERLRENAKKPVVSQAGFSLVELVVGIVVMAIALTYMSTVFFSSSGQSVEPMMQIRAAEFGQSLMDEILAKNFDEATPIGGLPACSPVTVACTVSGSLGSDGSEARLNFDDVDDYNNYCGDEIGKTGWPLVSSTGFNPDGFNNFRMRVCVGYDDDYDGVINEVGIDDLDAKLITIELFAPQIGGLGEAITFTAYKGNY